MLFGVVFWPNSAPFRHTRISEHMGVSPLTGIFELGSYIHFKITLSARKIDNYFLYFHNSICNVLYCLLLGVLRTPGIST